MQDLNIALVQANQVWEDKTANFRNYERLLGSVEGADLIVLPEMFQTAFTMNSAELAEDMNGESVVWLKQIAQQKSAAVYASLIVKEEGNYYNRGVFATPDGNLAYYDKRHLFAMAGEDAHFSAGEKSTIVTYKGWNINLQICFDLRFPENCRNFKRGESADYDLLLYVANWPERRITHWSALLQARAIENQCYVVGVNRVGTDAMELNYNGSSAIFNALGEKLSNLPENSESVQQIAISAKALSEVRERLPFLKK